MNRKVVFGVALMVGVLAAGFGAALYIEGEPITERSSADEPITDFPTATPNEADSSQASSPVAFSLTIDRVDECGQTCRDVTVTLQNNRNTTATGVTVYTRIHAGENNTAEDDIVWEQQRAVGSMDAGEARTTTERVDLSVEEGLQIKQHDGWITIVTSVESDQDIVTFRDSKQVA